MAASPAKRAGLSRLLCMALSALFVQRSVLAALPPASVGSSSQSEPAPAASTPAATPAGAPEGEEETWWQKVGLISPRYAWYGSLGYEWLSNSSETQKSKSQGLTSLLGARFNSYVWQPWFGRFTGDLRMHLGQNSTNNGDIPGASGSTRNLMMTGNARLSLLHRSRFPFEAYYDRNYSRTTAEFSPMMGSTLSQRFGFTQSYTHETGANGSLDWNRSTQSGNNDFGGTSTDSLLLMAAHKLPEHTMGGAFGHTTTKQDGIDSYSKQNNISVSHNYAPEEEDYAIDSTANVNTTSYRFENDRSNAKLAQINSVATWRPEDEPYTMTAAARVLGLASELSDRGDPDILNKRSLNTVNLSLGMTYTLSSETYAYGSINANSSSANGEKRNTTSETVSITHSPEGKYLGKFFYRWSTSAGASHNGEADGNSSSQLSLQLSHSLNRNHEFDGGSRINFNVTQAIAAAVQSRRRTVQEPRLDMYNPDTAGGNKRLSHNAGISWTSNEGITNAVVYLSFSDSRVLGGATETFQMVNLQFTGNLQTGADSSWSGNLAIQGIKQDIGELQRFVSSTQQNGEIKVTSNGGMSYRNGRLFGVRRLSFSSSVRLSSSALLPMLGGASDYETAAWDTRLDYMIGRLTLRANALISRNVTPIIRRTADGFELAEGEPKINKSIMFTVTRTFGY